MPTLTNEQRQYIKEHPKESPQAMANKFGCSTQSIYWWLHRYLGDSFLEVKRNAVEEKYRVVTEMYPTHSATEVAKVLGITKAAVNNMARRLGVRHTKETDKRILKDNVSCMIRPSSIEKRKESLKRTLRLERWRVQNGFQQKTKRHISTTPNRCLCTRSYLTRQYNYFYDKDYGEMLTIFFDSETRRLPKEKEQYYSEKYHIKFLQADE